MLICTRVDCETGGGKNAGSSHLLLLQVCLFQAVKTPPNMPQSVLTSCLHLDDMTQPLYARLGTRETTHQASPAVKGPWSQEVGGYISKRAPCMSPVWQNRGTGKEAERTNLVSLPLPNPLTNSLSESEVISAATKQQTENISARMEPFSFTPSARRH